MLSCVISATLSSFLWLSCVVFMRKNKRMNHNYRTHTSKRRYYQQLNFKIQNVSSPKNLSYFDGTFFFFFPFREPQIWLQKPASIGGCVGGGDKSYFLVVKLFSPWSSSVRVILKHENLNSRTLLGYWWRRSVGEGSKRPKEEGKSPWKQRRHQERKFKKSLDLK